MARDTEAWVRPEPGRIAGCTPPALSRLQQALAAAQPGPCQHGEAVAAALVRAWNHLHGSYAGEMCREKLVGAVVDLRWSPPVLSFGVQRGHIDGHDEEHVQAWQVDVQDGVAWIATERRLTLPPKTDAAALAVALVEQLVTGGGSPAVVSKPGGRVSIRPGEVPGLDIGFAETLAGRHRRFRGALDQAMAAAGFTRVGAYRYRRVA
jgi:hypothetical protein